MAWRDFERDEVAILQDCIQSYPLPIADACEQLLLAAREDALDEWALLSRDVLHSVLIFLSHSLLADVVSNQLKIPHLYHRIIAILNRPLGGTYVGFLREMGRYYHQHRIQSDVADLIAFLYRAEIEASILPGKRSVLGDPPKNTSNLSFPQKSEIHFPGLRTPILAIWITYDYFSDDFQK